jgi:hypothetical protein
VGVGGLETGGVRSVRPVNNRATGVCRRYIYRYFGDQLDVTFAARYRYAGVRATGN